MSFSFGFSPDTSDAGDDLKAPSVTQSSWFSPIEDSLSGYLSQSLLEVPFESRRVRAKPFEINGVVFRQINDVGDHEIDSESDLIPGVYGGGLKIWECTLDLMRYLLEERSSLPPMHCKVLDLGCGHGFPGITALMLGFRDVTFIDLNVEVIRDATWPTIQKNITDSGALHGVKCLAGHWLSMINLCREKSIKYDFILSSETLYSMETCQQVTFFLLHCLNVNGVALLATKKFYFGVGGGTFEFQRLCESLPGFEMNVVRSFQDGHSNIRDIVMVRRLY